MSRLLSGGIELKIKHVVEIGAVIGFPPSRFFHASYPTAEGGGNDAARLQRLLEQLHPVHDTQPETAEQPQATPAPNQNDIERLVYSALAKFFANMGGTGPTSSGSG